MSTIVKGYNNFIHNETNTTAAAKEKAGTGQTPETSKEVRKDGFVKAEAENLPTRKDILEAVGMRNDSAITQAEDPTDTTNETEAQKTEGKGLGKHNMDCVVTGLFLSVFCPTAGLAIAGAGGLLWLSSFFTNEDTSTNPYANSDAIMTKLAAGLF